MERRTRVPADPQQLAVLNQFLRAFWTAAALAPGAIQPFELALEEIFMNIVTHGSEPGRTPCVEVTLDGGPGESATMTVEDDGPEFDPLSLPPPDLSVGLDQRPVGGLGVFLVRQMMDTVSYQRVGTRNQLRMTKTLAG
jgi:serine/threonine-protein kinase RsbW